MRVHPYSCGARKLLISLTLGNFRPRRLVVASFVSFVSADAKTHSLRCSSFPTKAGAFVGAQCARCIRRRRRSQALLIPNTEVKLTGADNTWLATARNDRWMPTYKNTPVYTGVFLYVLKVGRHLYFFCGSKKYTFKTKCKLTVSCPLPSA